MIDTNLCTIQIEDVESESTIDIELPFDTMYKLYRIKEINAYDTFLKYRAYEKMQNQIKKIINDFMDSIDQNFEDQVHMTSDDIINFSKQCFMDYLMVHGTDYNHALTLVSNFDKIREFEKRRSE